MAARRSRARLGALLAPWALAVALGIATDSAADDCINLPEDRLTREIIVELEPAADFVQFALDYGCERLEWIPQLHVGRLLAPAGTDIDALAVRMEADQPRVKDADPHKHIEDPEGVQRTIADLTIGLTRTDYVSQTAAVLTHVPQATAAWSGAGVRVAVVDTGVSFANPELASVLIAPGISVLEGETTADIPPDGIDNDGDGNVDESWGHGTHVAGLVHLVAPMALILPIRALDDDGKGSSFSLARGIVAAVDASVDVINLSCGLPHDARAVESAMEYAAERNIAVVVAAGNRGLTCVDFPADRDEAIAVAAVDDNFVKTAWSSCGSEVALSAPGMQTLSTYGGADWSRWDGTSFATPFVTGGVALLMERYPGLLPADIKATLSLRCVQPDNNTAALRPLMGTGVIDLAKIADLIAPERGSVRVEEDEATGDDELHWEPVEGATHYDVARGSIVSLRRSGGIVDLGVLTCLADDVPAGTRVVDPAPPPPGGAFYVVRDDAPDAAGHSWGRSSRGEAQVASVEGCAP